VTDQYRVVLDGMGARTGTVASSPMTRAEAMAGFDVALDSMRADVRDGDIRVSVLAESEYQRRGRE
jgi:hypothetical protein